jgi:glycosyltransferase involved in cell wall biosynthesis
MKIHTVFITYNRLELTKQAIESYFETVTLPHTVWVVDNRSEDQAELLRLEGDFGISLLDENRYPGYACNRGWEYAPKDAELLHRADNDFAFLPGWCEEVEHRFSENPNLGQLGMRTDEEELHNGHNVGGNCVIRRELWDAGMRYDERPWPQIRVSGYTEDSFFSPEVVNRGWEWSRVQVPCIRSLSFEDPEDEYYIKTWADRGINL